MMLAPLLDNPIRARRHCWLLADSVDACLAMQNCSAIGAQRLQIFLGQNARGSIAPQLTCLQPAKTSRAAASLQHPRA